MRSSRDSRLSKLSTTSSSWSWSNHASPTTGSLIGPAALAEITIVVQCVMQLLWSAACDDHLLSNESLQSMRIVPHHGSIDPRRQLRENTLLTVDGLHHTFHDDVTLITGPAEGPEGDLFPCRAEERGLKCRGDAGTDPRGASRDGLEDAIGGVRKSIRQDIKPDIVHTHSSKAGIVGRAAAWDERVPAIVHTIHGLPFGPSERPMKNRLYVGLERWAARRVSRHRERRLRRSCRASSSRRASAGQRCTERFTAEWTSMRS